MYMNSRLVRHASLLIASAAVCALLGGCAALRVPETTPPPATPEQISREVSYLQEALFKDECIDRLLRAAPHVPDPQSLGRKAIYSVEFPANPLVSDGYAYALEVAEAHRMAYLFISGGIAGGTTVMGPIPLARCLHEALG